MLGGRMEAADVAVAEIVAEDDDDVGPSGGVSGVDWLKTRQKQADDDRGPSVETGVRKVVLDP